MCMHKKIAFCFCFSFCCCCCCCCCFQFNRNSIMNALFCYAHIIYRTRIVKCIRTSSPIQAPSGPLPRPRRRGANSATPLITNNNSSSNNRPLNSQVQQWPVCSRRRIVALTWASMERARPACTSCAATGWVSRAARWPWRRQMQAAAAAVSDALPAPSRTRLMLKTATWSTSCPRRCRWQRTMRLDETQLTSSTKRFASTSAAVSRPTWSWSPRWTWTTRSRITLCSSCTWIDGSCRAPSGVDTTRRPMDAGRPATICSSRYSKTFVRHNTQHTHTNKL